MSEKKSICLCLFLGTDGCCCYIRDYKVCGKPCTGKNKMCKHFHKSVIWPISAKEGGAK